MTKINSDSDWVLALHSPSMTYDDLQNSQCTNMNAADDLSNYWVPQLYVYKQGRVCNVWVHSTSMIFGPWKSPEH